MRIAVVDERGCDADVQSNLRTALDAIEHAAAEQADLVVFSECFLTGYNLTRNEVAKVALGDHSAVWRAITTAIVDGGLHVAVGAVTSVADRLFNSLRLYSPDGTYVQYNKIHIPHLGADRWLASGGGRFEAPVETTIGRIGLLVCYDVRFPEAARSLALAGAELLLIPACYRAGSERVPTHFPTVRAMENGVYVAMAAGGGSARGATFVSGTQIVTPDGASVGARIQNTNILLADLDLTSAGRDGFRASFTDYTLDIYGDRRPDRYAL